MKFEFKDTNINNLGGSMNVQTLSRAIKLAGILVVAIAYLFLQLEYVPLALITAWFGISIISSAFFIDCKITESRVDTVPAKSAISARAITGSARTAHSSR